MKRAFLLVMTLVLLLVLTIPMATPAQACGSPGCGYSPGYWKNHLDVWPAPYSSDMDFDTALGVDWFDPDITLLDGLKYHGGKGSDIIRYAVADLLNAAL